MSNNIKNVLKEKHITQRNIAKKIGITESAISHYIKGDRSPSGEVLVLLAKELHTTANHLLDEKDILEYAALKRILTENKNQLSAKEKKELIKILKE